MSKETKILLSIGLAAVVMVIGGALLFSKTTPSPAPQVVSDTEKSLLIKENSYQTNPSASVSVVEFADFECPACAAGYPIVKQMKQEFGDKVNFVFRYFPLDGHKNALTSARAVEAAGKQGKFWEMTDKIFSTQEKWSGSLNPTDEYFALAKELGLDENKFKEDFEDQANVERIRSDYQDGIKVGVNSTPTFFINGKKYVGVILPDEFRKILQDEIGQ